MLHFDLWISANDLYSDAKIYELCECFSLPPFYQITNYTITLLENTDEGEASFSTVIL